MSDRIVIPKATVALGYVPQLPLTWAPDSEGRRSGAWVVCENGHAALLDHDIDPNGVVHPSILCLTPMPDGSECGWHVFAVLEDWNV